MRKLILAALLLGIALATAALPAAPAANANPLTDIAVVSTGYQHTCALTIAGGVKCWGQNLNGQLGNGTTTDSSTPVAVPGFESGVSAISAGGQHTCAVKNGGVWCWGRNHFGQLGNNSTAESHVPVAVSGLTSGFTTVSAGYNYSCALKDGGISCWGANGAGQLGNVSSSVCPLGPCSLVPVQVLVLTSGVNEIASGFNHVCALKVGGAWCWGWNNRGMLGNGSTANSNTPVAVPGFESGVSAISAGGQHTCAVKNGGVWCWGANYSGQLGNNSTTESHVPVAVSGLTNGASTISAGGEGTCSVKSTGGISCWGRNDYGQLGNTSTTGSNVPVEVSGFASGGATVSAEQWHTCALTTAGDGKCWGSNSVGQLGNGTTTGPELCPYPCSTVPVDVVSTAKGPPTDHKVLFVDGIGSSSNCSGEKDDGEANLWTATSSLQSHLLGFGSGYEWLGPMTGLGVDDFAFYEYTDLSAQPDGCGVGVVQPNYRNRESCWSLNDKSFTGTSVPNGGQGFRFANYVKSLLDNDPGAVLSIIGFSQGGVLATYAIDEGLIPSAYRARIRTVITVDSPFGIPSGAAPLVDSVFECPNKIDYDSAWDFRSESDVIRHIKDNIPPPGTSPRPHLFTVNEQPGTGLCLGQSCLEVVSDSMSQVPWQTGHLSVGAENHGDSLRSWFTSPSEEKRFLYFVGCALSGASYCSGVTTMYIPPGTPVSVSGDMYGSTSEWTAEIFAGTPGAQPSGQQSGALAVAGASSTYTTTLVDPNGIPYTSASLPPGATYVTSDGYQRFTVPSPEVGQWHIEIATSDPAGVTVNVAQSVTYLASADADQDNVLDTEDNCVAVANISQADTDGDGLGDECDDDIDEDTVVNAVDNCLFVANAGQADIDSDGLGDACDGDSDNDLLDDSTETDLGTQPLNADTDGDGLIDGIEVYFEGTDPLLADTDADGCADAREVGADETLGGLRDPLNPWDFYDVSGATPGVPDGDVNLLTDILSVIQHYAPQGGPPYDANYDRGPSAGPNAWNMTAPDGVIDLLNDILGVIRQYDHRCT